MVLLIDDVVCSAPASIDQLSHYESLVGSSSTFAKSTEISQPVEEISRTIYVAQREFAVLSLNDPHNFRWLGSDDATTCHLFILRNKSATALAHLDGCETNKSIKRICDELDQYSADDTYYDLYLAGGFIEESNRNYSKSLSNEILAYVSQIPDRHFRLKLAAITHINDHIVQGTHFPLIYGLRVDATTNNLHKMNFVDFGPAFELRMVYNSTSSHCVHCIYSSRIGEIHIPSFQIDRKHVNEHYAALYKYYFRDDQKLLRLTSTSPVQERPTYLINMKKTIKYIIEFHEEIPRWFDPYTHLIVYRWKENKWITDNRLIIERIHIDS